MTDSQDAMYAGLYRPDGKPTWPFFIRRSSGELETALQYLKDNPAFSSEEFRVDLLNRIKNLPGQVVKSTKSTGWASIPIQAINDKAVWDGFTSMALHVRARTAALSPGTT